MNFVFSNLLGAPYRGGTLLIHDNQLLTPVGNRVGQVGLYAAQGWRHGGGNGAPTEQRDVVTLLKQVPRCYAGEPDAIDQPVPTFREFDAGKVSLQGTLPWCLPRCVPCTAHHRP